MLPIASDGAHHRLVGSHRPQDRIPGQLGGENTQRGQAQRRLDASRCDGEEHVTSSAV